MTKNCAKSMVLLCFTVILIASCENEDTFSQEVSDISIKVAPTKLVYIAGEALDLSGMVLTLINENGGSQEINYTEFENNGITCSPNNGDVLREGLKNIKITHDKSESEALQSISFTSLVDIDGNNYPVVRIGNQIWMAKNLQTTHFNDGLPIPLVEDTLAWYDLNTPAFCWYDNDSAKYAVPYGALYNWRTVETGKLCPSGWKVPSEADFNELVNFLGGRSLAGGKLKDSSSKYWDSPNTGATNESGFNALPGGYLDYQEFRALGLFGYWWSSTKTSNVRAVEVIMLFNSAAAAVGEWEIYSPESVRCIKKE